MQTQQIFLASSRDLREDREAFQQMIGQINQDWIHREMVFQVVLWEDFLDAMSPAGLQQQYNKAAAEADIFVLLFSSKVGPYTAQEFESAFAAHRANDRPVIYTYFKDTPILTGDIDRGIVTMLDFKDRLAQLGHYVTRYASEGDLMWHFSRQLYKLYGADRLVQALTDSTPQSQVDTIAHELARRWLSEVDALARIDVARLRKAIGRASATTRSAIFGLATELRRVHWFDDKPLMERTIPVFEALTEVEPDNHLPLAQLAYAVKDHRQPDWTRAARLLDRAIAARGPVDDAGFAYYEFNRALCSIRGDSAFNAQPPAPSAPELKKAVTQDLRAAKRWIASFDDMLKQPPNRVIGQWLQLNGVRRLA